MTAAMNSENSAPANIGHDHRSTRAHVARLTNGAVFAGAIFLNVVASYADSGTWLANPINNGWNTAANWSSNTVPNGLTDDAEFGFSNTTNVAVSGSVDVSVTIFNLGASVYTITSLPNTALTFNPGIINNSGVMQNFIAASDETGAGLFQFAAVQGGDGSGDLSNFVLEGGKGNGSQAGGASFNGVVSAMGSTFLAGGGQVAGAHGAFIDFLGPSALDRASIVCEGGEVSGAAGAVTTFYANGTADTGTITANGGMISGAGGATTLLMGNCRANAATLIANGGSNGGTGGLIEFHKSSSGDSARVEVFGNGNLDIGSHSGGVTIGSLEGDGLVFLGGQALSIGSGVSSTTFSGVIQDRGISGKTGGALIKIGTTTLTLTGANIYTGGTTVSGGTLVISNTTASGAGTGTVTVNAGTLGGSGTISGGVTIGTGSGAGAFLAPAHGTQTQTTLTIQSPLTLNADSTYTYTFKAKKKKAKTDKVIASGVAINSGATFVFSGTAQGVLKQGLVLTAISNTAATPIAGTFSNLPDGAILTVSGNNFQASYSGGDGNDLTLTVVP